MKFSEFKNGLIHGVPVMLAYLFVSFSFGIMATSMNLTILQSVFMSFTNLTSAGQYDGLLIIAQRGTIVEMIICQVIINLRYSLMSISLSQKIDESFTLKHKLIASFGITDEIFAIAISREEKITPYYMYGLMSLPILGWSFGTFLGAAAGDVLPEFLINALGILLFGMFISIIITPIIKDFKVLLPVLLSVLFSCLFYYILPGVNTGLSVVISALVAAIISALIFPKKIEEDKA